MQIELPSGTTWHVRDAGKKLAYRAQLPGARVFDLVGGEPARGEGEAASARAIASRSRSPRAGS